MRILVTGANGVVGRAVVKSLATHGHEVFGLIKREGKKSVVTDVGGMPVVGDLDNADTYRHAKDVDVIVHAAQADYYRKRVTPGLKKAVAERDARWTRGLIEAGAGRAKCFVYTSTSLVYGDRKEEVSEENSPLNQFRIGDWKAPTEQLAMTLCKQHGYGSTIIVRPAMVYSAYVERGIFAHGILGPMLAGKPAGYKGDGNQWFSLIHEDDLGELYARAIEEQPPIGIYNAVDDEPVKNNEWMPYLAQKLGAKKPLGFPALAIFVIMGRLSLEVFSSHVRLSGQKAKRELDWAPKYPSYREGIAQVVEELTRQGKLGTTARS